MIRDLSPVFIALDQYKRLARQLAEQLRHRGPTAYERNLIAEVDALDRDTMPPDLPPPPPEDCDGWRSWD